MNLLLPSWWKLALAGALLAATFHAGWTVQGWRKDVTLEQWLAAAAQAARDAEAQARKTEAAMAKQLEDARHAATERETTLRADAAAARGAAAGLRGDLAALRASLPEMAADACRVRADVLAELFGACAERYTAVAAEADRIGSDQQTVMDAWPKNQQFNAAVPQ